MIIIFIIIILLLLLLLLLPIPSILTCFVKGVFWPAQ